MPLLQDDLFFGRADLADFREISANITDATFEIFIREAQTIEVRGFVGNELYRLLLDDWNGTDFDTQRFADLWYGVDYTNSESKPVRFNGLMSAAIYFSYSRFLLQQQNNVDRFGVSQLNNEISESATAPQVRGKAGEARQVAMRYQNDAKTFLLDKATTYPEWADSQSRTPKTSSFGFFKV